MNHLIITIIIIIIIIILILSLILILILINSLRTILYFFKYNLLLFVAKL